MKVLPTADISVMGGRKGSPFWPGVGASSGVREP